MTTLTTRTRKSVPQRCRRLQVRRPSSFRLLLSVVVSLCLSFLVESASAQRKEGGEISPKETSTLIASSAKNNDNDIPNLRSADVSAKEQEEGTTTNDDSNTPNLRFGFGGGLGGPPPPPGGFIRDTSNREIVRLHSELKLIFEPGAGATITASDVVSQVLNDPAAVTALQEVTGLYFYQLFQNTQDSAFVGTEAKFSMDDVTLVPDSDYPIHFVAQIEMDSTQNSVSSKDIQRLMTNRHFLNEYLKELKQTSSTNAYRHVEKVVLLVIRHGGE